MKLPLHGYYFLAPILTFALWSTCIFGLLGLWGADGFPRYKEGNATVVFISDAGAAHKTFFIIFACLSAAFYMLTTLIERHLRHLRRIPGSLRKRHTAYDVLSVFFAIVGAIGLILLSIFDAFNHSTVHWSMTVVFVAGVAISVLFQTLQIFSLSNYHDSSLWHLRVMAIVKAVILGVALCVLVGFIATYARCRGDVVNNDGYCNRVVSAAGICEWLMAFLLSLFFLTYVVDMWPARRRAKFGVTEDGTMVQDPARAAEHGQSDKPMAPYAIARDMGPNQSPEAYNSMTSTQASPSLHQQPLKESEINTAHYQEKHPHHQAYAL